MTQKKFLIPVDGSEHANHALAYAIDRLEREAGATAVLLTVHPPLRIYGEVRLYVGEDKMTEMAAAHDRSILEPAEAEMRRHRISFASEAAEGDAATLIAERAAKHGCTEIVMGSRGLGHVGGLVLGSVATKVVHLVQMPVTLVK